MNKHNLLADASDLLAWAEENDWTPEYILEVIDFIKDLDSKISIEQTLAVKH